MSSGKDDPFPFPISSDPISSNKSYDDDKLIAFSSLYENEQIGIVQIVTEYISKLSSKHKGLVSDISQSLNGGMKSILVPEGEAVGPFLSTRKNEIAYSHEYLVLLGKELKVFFEVPSHQILSSITPTLNRNEAVAVLINFFLLMTEAIGRIKEGLIHCIKGSIENLRRELGFLITFLGDKAMHLQPTKNIVIDIEAVADEVGKFFYSFFLSIVVYTTMPLIDTSNPVTDIETVVNWVKRFCHSLTLQMAESHEFVAQSFSDFFIFTKYYQDTKTRTLSLALSDLLTMFDLLRTKIANHCITVSKMPMDMAPKTAVVSLFIVDSVLDELMDLINNKSDRIVAVNNQTVMLHEELVLLGSSIKDIAEQSEAECEELVLRAGYIAYEVEYVINSFPHVWYLSLRLSQLIEKIQLFTMAVKKIKNNVGATGPGMPKVGKYPDEQASSQSEKSPMLEDTIVGFKVVATEIAEQLVRGTCHLQIISVFGMPGLGKTTLANKLYNDPFVVYHFDKRSWCVVSQRYNKKNVLIEILSSMSLTKRETFMHMEEESLAENLYKNLKGRRYLIVIDDIWDVTVWNDLRRYFPNDGIGSRILFTTRNKEVGLKASPHSVINALPFLSEVECWELLQWKVFQGKNCPRELIHIGKQIATNCSGLPLAVVVIAGVLANMEKKEHLWLEVARNLSSYISKNPGNYIQILDLSYKHLPMHLRPCFLYFGAFEEDKEISVRKLMCLWVAEGYVRKEEKKCLEDLALKYLMELIDRSLVLVSKRRSDGEIKTCKIHDILHEMCLRIAEEKKYLKMVKLNHDDPRFISQVLMYQQHRCLSIDCKPFANHSLSSGRFMYPPSFVLSGFPTLNSRSFKVIRVLEFLDVCTVSKSHFSKGFVPPMESFHKLEFFVLENSHQVEIPEILLNMVSLRHMHFRGGACFSASCRQQATEDENFIMNNNLRSISVLSISDETDEKILRCLPNLRRLKARVRYSVNRSFDFFSRLESLKLLPYENDLRDSGSTLTSLPLNLKQLTRVEVHMSPEQMEVIAKLQCLVVLKLVHVSFEGRQWDASEVVFPQLEFLKLCWVQIAEWNASSDNFPRLQRLVLQNCYNLKMIPPSLGDILTLQKIEVHMCSKAIRESAKQIQEEQEENGNEDLKVIITEWRP